MSKLRVLIGGVKRLREMKEWNWLFIFELLLMVTICIIHALPSGHYANFYPLNGTFQNFNPVRRLLDGQIPYRDFQDYLGIGHLYIGTLATWLFGADYRSSLVAFSFLSFLGLAICSYVIGLAVFGKKEISLAMTNIVLVALLVQPTIFTSTLTGTSEILEALQYALGIGNSARFVRGMILPLLCLLIWAGYKLYKNRLEDKTWIGRHRNLCIYGACGFLGGFAFTWSNDYGISCWVCLILMIFWVALARNRKLGISLLDTIYGIVGSFAGLLLSVEIFTLGHFTQWLTATFGTGGYQSWYYNSLKSYYLYDVDFSYIMLMQAGICIIYMIKIFMARGSVVALRRYGIPAFCNMVCFCAVNEYCMLSGNEAREVALSILFFAIIYETVRLVAESIASDKKRFMAIGLSAVIGLSWVVSSMKEEFVFKYMTEPKGDYVEALGGNLTNLGEDLLRADEFLDGDRFFATYASAQEVVSDLFQPSGTDYIIHVLGDKQREDYMEAYRSGDFEYVATIKETYTDWEYWVQRANWFLYRELYRDWHPVYSNTYEVYWERNSSNGQNVIKTGYSLQIEDISESSKKIIIQADPSVNGMADVYIDYTVSKNARRSSALVFRTALKAKNTGTVYADDGVFYEMNYLRPESAEYIPVRIVNGYGEITLSSDPESNTVLQLNDISCNQIFTCSSDYVEVAEISQNEGNSIVKVEKAQKYVDSLTNAGTVMIQGMEYRISDMTSDDENIYIVIPEEVVCDLRMSNYMVVVR